MIIIILILSIIFSLAAAWLALRLIPLSGGKLAWVLIACAFVLRAVRLPLQLFFYLDPHTEYALVVIDELLGLAISILGAFGMYWIAPFFVAFRQAEEDREFYLHAISHDLRSPLTVIQGHADLLSRDLGKLVEKEENLRAILHASARLHGMTTDLVDSARWQGGKLELKREQIDLASFLQEMLIGDFLTEERQRISAEIPPGLPPIEADRDRLTRILLNLLGNALKYSPADKQVRLRVMPADKEVCFCIEDRGPGIPRQDIPHLFNKYFRGGEGTRKGGIGLGLHITKILVEAHSGRLWVESTPGKGSSFFFTIPART